MKNKGKENFNREGGTVDKDSIKKLIGVLILSAMPAERREELHGLSLLLLVFHLLFGKYLLGRLTLIGDL